MAQKEQFDIPLPPFAPFPEASFRKDLVPEEWEACLDAWIVLAEAHLHLPDGSFFRRVENDQSGLIDFLTSYCHEISQLPNDPTISKGSKATSLRRLAFLLVHRLLSSDKIPDALLDSSFLADFAMVYSRSASLRDLLSSLWKRRGKEIEENLYSTKSDVIKGLELGNVEDPLLLLRQLIPLFHASPDAGAFFMVGSDLLDGLGRAYTDATDPTRKILVAFAYVCLTSLCKGDKPNFSLLSDHLYSLKANAEQLKPSKSLLADIVTNTSLLQIVKDKMAVTDAARARKLEAALTPFNDPSIAWPKKAHAPRIDKGKAKAKDSFGDGVNSEIHIHRMSLITQIQDLFPDLGSAFIMKLLDEYADDVETVTAHLLDNSLPPHLQNLDRTEQLPPFSTTASDLVPDLVPRSTPSPPPQERRNIFDDDDLSNLTTSALSRLHLGRKDAALDADTVLADRTTAPNKAAILSALAAFDSDDDERDDTYDVEDVGGTVDTTASTNPDEAGEDKNEEVLYAAWKVDPSVFGREAATRRGEKRRKLREETGMTDEMIEGWGIMLGRDPRRVRRLEAKYGTWSGQQQNVIERTAWRVNEENEDEGGEGSVRSGRGRGRGRVGGGFGRGKGNVAGPTTDEGTQRARHRKEASKGSRANHNRRDQRARKMTRGGLPG